MNTTSRLGEERIPLSFKVIVEPPLTDTRPAGTSGEDFRANRTIPPHEVVKELQENVDDYIAALKNETTLATKMKKAVDDIAAVVQNGIEFEKEISGAAVVDMQVLLFNTRNMLKNKERYMSSFKNESNEQQGVARRLRSTMIKQQRSVQIQKQFAKASLSELSQSYISSTTRDETRLTNYGDTSMSTNDSLQEELSFLRRRVAELETSQHERR
mmetsp:Transcript_34205/g.77011  ORF Transcript_34205/g.77011 Transcript_34205/m.77011 type:complete len:214 (-) Transcript_34205:67-708(-)